MVNKYVEKLTSINFGKTSAKIEPCQIGVVTPYIRQVSIQECSVYFTLYTCTSRRYIKLGRV